MSDESCGDHFESLFEYAPISLLLEDYSEVKMFLDALRANGVVDLASYLDAHPKEVETRMHRVVVTRVNQATLNIFRAKSQEELVSNVDQIFRAEMLAHFRAGLLALWDGEAEWSGNGISYRLDGEQIHARLHWRILPECESTWECILVTIEDVTALKKAEMRYHHLFTYAPISLWEEDYTAIKAEFDRLRAQGVTNLRSYLTSDPAAIDRFIKLIRVLDVNQKTLDLFGAADKTTLFANLDKVFRDDMKKHFINELVEMWYGRTFYERESVNFSLTGELVNVQVAWTLMPGSEKDFSWVLVALQDVTARKKVEEYLRYLGTHDVMTGLYNRAYFEETLIKLEKTRRDPISVVILDLNYLKVTNDQFGHNIGDKLIRRAAEVLQAGTSANDVVARIGGDEFIILMPDAGINEAYMLIERIQSMVAVNNQYYREPELSISLGAAVSTPGLSLEKVISIADDEMYKNKGSFHRRRKEDVTKKP